MVQKDVVIVFDVSRSMQSLLKQAKGAVKAVLNTLGPNDRVRLFCSNIGQSKSSPGNEVVLRIMLIFTARNEVAAR